ncbi:MAG: hypothetical protein ACXVZN_01365 [Gaiellaceae bacterium]
MTSRLFALAAVSAVALVPAAHGTVGTSAGPLTTAPNVFDEIQVTITDARISLNKHTANRGDEGRFVIRNVGTKPHTFTLGKLAHGTGQNAQGLGKRKYGTQSGFATTIKPREQKIFLLFFDFRGPIPYGSTTPADRGKAGMKGTFTIH